MVQYDDDNDDDNNNNTNNNDNNNNNFEISLGLWVKNPVILIFEKETSFKKTISLKMSPAPGDETSGIFDHALWPTSPKNV